MNMSRSSINCTCIFIELYNHRLYSSGTFWCHIRWLTEHSFYISSGTSYKIFSKYSIISEKILFKECLNSVFLAPSSASYSSPLNLGFTANCIPKLHTQNPRSINASIRKKETQNFSSTEFTLCFQTFTYQISAESTWCAITKNFHN